jgi:hypothetical protein
VPPAPLVILSAAKNPSSVPHRTLPPGPWPNNTCQVYSPGRSRGRYLISRWSECKSVWRFLRSEHKTEWRSAEATG